MKHFKSHHVKGHHHKGGHHTYKGMKVGVEKHMRGVKHDSAAHATHHAENKAMGMAGGCNGGECFVSRGVSSHLGVNEEHD